MQVVLPRQRQNQPGRGGRSTLAVAALFTPVRRVQQVVDRRFNRARYGADRTPVWQHQRA